MLKVGITGGIGSGKTTICRIFEVLGLPVFYADVVAKQLMNSDAYLKQSIQDCFGEQSYGPDGRLNTSHLASIVFNDQEQLVRLNGLVHPAVFKAFDYWAANQHQAPYVLKEAALLFESDSYKLCDYSLLVQAPIDLKIQRVMLRDNVSAQEIERRMSKQWSDAQKFRLADFIIINDEQHLLIPQVIALHEFFLKNTNTSR